MRKIILTLFTLFLLVGCTMHARGRRGAMRWCPIMPCQECPEQNPCKYDTVKRKKRVMDHDQCNPCFHCGECLRCDIGHASIKGCPMLPDHCRRAPFFKENREETSLLTRNY